MVRWLPFNRLHPREQQRRPDRFGFVCAGSPTEGPVESVHSAVVAVCEMPDVDARDRAVRSADGSSIPTGSCSRNVSSGAPPRASGREASSIRNFSGPRTQVPTKLLVDPLRYAFGTIPSPNNGRSPRGPVVFAQLASAESCLHPTKRLPATAHALPQHLEQLGQIRSDAAALNTPSDSVHDGAVP